MSHKVIDIKIFVPEDAPLLVYINDVFVNDIGYYQSQLGYDLLQFFSKQPEPFTVEYSVFNVDEEDGVDLDSWPKRYSEIPEEELEKVGIYD